MHYVALLLLLSACSSQTLKLPETSDANTRTESTQTLGQLAQKQQTSYAQQAKDRIGFETRLLRISEQLHQGANRLCAQFNPKDTSCIYPIRLSHDSKGAAYAEKGSIYVSPSTLRQYKQDESVAFFAAREWAHLFLKHKTSWKSENMFGAFVGAMTDSVMRQQGIYTGAQFYRTGRNLKKADGFAATSQSEVDYVALYLLHHSGYAINNLGTIWSDYSLKHKKRIPAKRTTLLKQTIAEIQSKKQSGQIVVPSLK